MILKPKLICIAGPTAVGKTSLSIRLAKRLKCPVISFDSRQVYKLMNIGTAKPSKAEMQGISHYFIDTLDPSETYTAAIFGREARALLHEHFKHNNTVVAVGGTGLYLKALLNQLDVIPEVPIGIRNHLRAEWEKDNGESLRNEAKRCLPKFATAENLGNKHRLIRALEVWRHTGKCITTFFSPAKSQIEEEFHSKVFVLTAPKPWLYDRINKRVDEMVLSGLKEEALSLIHLKSFQALQTVGYKEWYEYQDDGLAIEKIKQHSRNYAKRQQTWFAKYKEDYHHIDVTKQDAFEVITQALSEMNYND